MASPTLPPPFNLQYFPSRCVMCWSIGVLTWAPC
eukprot:CCRYP_020000-RA/>CCRYP_020000-RA protein AED:0.36 eAED:1.00 QI:0/-1/0/1/-1/0/1/0/33